MTEDEIAEMKLKESLLQAMRRNGGQALRVTIKNFVAAAELVKHDQAECFDDFGRPALHPRAAVVFSSARGARRSRFLPTGKNLPFLKSLSVHGTSRERNCPFGFFVFSAT
jgi:hypothetical protein